MSESLLSTRCSHTTMHQPSTIGKFFTVDYLYQQTGWQFVLSEDSTLIDDEVVDESFVNNSVAALSIS